MATGTDWLPFGFSFLWVTARKWVRLYGWVTVSEHKLAFQTTRTWAGGGRALYNHPWINTSWSLHVQVLLRGLGCASLSQRKTLWWKYTINIWQHLPCVSCAVYRLSLSTDNPVLFKEKTGGFKNTAKTSDSLNQLILYLFSDHVYHISAPSARHLRDVITHLPGVVCSLIPPEHWSQRQDRQSVLSAFTCALSTHRAELTPSWAPPPPLHWCHYFPRCLLCPAVKKPWECRSPCQICSCTDHQQL